MPKYSDCARLSWIVYYEKNQPAPPVGWEGVDGCGCPSDICPDSHYHAEVFINHDVKEIIMAFRGTTDSWWEKFNEDFLDIWLHEEAPTYYRFDVIPHIELVKQKIAEINCRILDARNIWARYAPTEKGTVESC